MKQKELAKKLASTMHVGVFPLEFDAKQDKVPIPGTIHLIPIGQWDHDLYGNILITPSDIQEFVSNFNASIRKGVFITAGHEGFEELPAVAWITAVEARDTGLWGMVEWNNQGRSLLEDKAYKFFSPEFYRDYEDPQTHIVYRNVLTGGALTKSPYFKELEAVVFSDKLLKKKFNNNNNDMNLKELLAKDITTLSDEEKAFIKSQEAELSAEEKESHKSILVAEVATETEEEKTAREAKEAQDKIDLEAKETGDANEAAGLNRDGSAKVAASEKVQITAGELATLRFMADKGAQAFKELAAAKLNDAVKALSFSDTNKAGKFLPKDVATLKTFMESLNEKQQLSFSALMKLLPEAKTTEIFKEVGANSGAAEGTAQAEVNSKIDAKMKADPKLKYSDALKQVMSETKGLEERYDAELPAVGKKVSA